MHDEEIIRETSSPASATINTCQTLSHRERAYTPNPSEADAAPTPLTIVSTSFLTRAVPQPWRPGVAPQHLEGSPASAGAFAKPTAACPGRSTWFRRSCECCCTTKQRVSGSGHNAAKYCLADAQRQSAVECAGIHNCGTPLCQIARAEPFSN